VRGIGLALQGAQLAMQGDTTAVTGGLGISFNSTLVALTLSIVLVYTLHEIQLAQERLCSTWSTTPTTGSSAACTPTARK